jgi:hypothetical protein
MLSSCRPVTKDLIMKILSRVKPDGGNGIPNGHLFCQVLCQNDRPSLLLQLCYFVKFPFLICQVCFVKMLGLQSKVQNCRLHISSATWWTPHRPITNSTLSNHQVCIGNPTFPCQIIKCALGILHFLVKSTSFFRVPFSTHLPSVPIYLQGYLPTYL